MESDSDSDGSHISATPPREPLAHPLQSPGLLYVEKSKVSSTTMKTLKPKISLRKKSGNITTKSIEQNQSSLDPFSNSSHLPGSSLRILRVSEKSYSDLKPDSADTIRAGHFGMSSLFSSSFKSRKSSFDLLENADDLAVPPRGSMLDFSNCQNGHTKIPSNDPVSALRSIHPNSIGTIVNTSTPKLNKAKGDPNGNFVKLRINGYGRKFTNKGHKRKSSSQRYRKYRRSLNVKDKSQTVTNVEPCEEDGLLPIPSHSRNQIPSEAIDEIVRAVRSDPSEKNLKNLLTLTHGYHNFRNGQLEAIKKVITGQSTMLVLPTGGGKSLCYQLAALVLPGIVLVVSPLIALMIDQLRQLPNMISGSFLSSNQTIEEIAHTLDELKAGNIKVLFVSPERFSNVEFLSILGAGLEISLVVVDEAHCISEWSHNFRPSYLRLTGSLIRTKLGANCVLAMTATATVQTLEAVVSALEIPETNLIQICQIRNNLELSVNFTDNKMKDLMLLLKSSPLVEVKSVIIYCKFQFETDMISKYLCDNNIASKSYHSGIPPKDRHRIQDQFCSNKIRVVVATVAFGMGLDKSDVGAVIHYSLPESLEEYVQEIGRAGRDGKLSYCHLLLDDVTYIKLRSLSYSDGVDDYAVTKLLHEVFNGDSSRQRLWSLIKESTSHKFDMKEEVIHTVLTYLELGETKYLRLLPELKVTCTLHFHKTSPFSLASKDIVISAILKKSEIKNGNYIFDILTAARDLSISATDITNHLKRLQSLEEITIDFKDPAFIYEVVKVPEDILCLSAQVKKRLFEVERSKVQKLDIIYSVAYFAAKQCNKSDGCLGSVHTFCLQRNINDYFNNDYDTSNLQCSHVMGKSNPFLRADIKVFLQSNSNMKFTPRAVARIMHSIPSPAFPSSVWSKSHFWGRYSQIDFSVVMETAKLELMNLV